MVLVAEWMVLVGVPIEPMVTISHVAYRQKYRRGESMVAGFLFTMQSHFIPRRDLSPGNGVMLGYL